MDLPKCSVCFIKYGNFLGRLEDFERKGDELARQDAEGQTVGRRTVLLVPRVFQADSCGFGPNRRFSWFEVDQEIEEVAGEQTRVVSFYLFDNVDRTKSRSNSPAGGASICHTPERSGLPFGERGALAERFGLPSRVNGVPGLG